MDDISASLEDYLEMIFILHRKGGEVRVTDIASSLKVSKPSVNRAVGALKEAGLLEHEFYGTIALTPEGETRAAQVLRRHRMIRHFLHHTLGVPEEIADTQLVFEKSFEIGIAASHRCACIDNFDYHVNKL